MKKSTKIKLIVSGIIAVLVAVALLQAETGFISKRIVDEKKEEYYNTYGLSEEDWELLNAEGITIEDAHAMEMQSNRISAVGELLDEILIEIKNGTYNSEEEDEDIDLSSEELFLKYFSDIEGAWEANDIVREGTEYAHLYIKITSTEDPLSFKAIVYDRQSEQILREMDLEIYVIGDKELYLKSQTTNESLAFTKYTNAYSMNLRFSDNSIYDTKNFYYDLTRITEEEFNNPTPIQNEIDDSVY